MSGLRVSVVVSTRNRARRLDALLTSLAAQTLPAKEFEVVIVDDGSTDETPEVLGRWSRESAVALSVVMRPRPSGPAAGRNAGWRATSAPLVAFTDDDCEATPKWLEHLLETAENHPGSIVQGITKPIERELGERGLFSRTIEVERLGPYFETCNVAFPRSVLDLVGGFDEVTFASPGGEDTDLAWRAMAHGVTPHLSDQALVHHAVNQLGRIGMLRLALHWSETMAVFARHPSLRSHLYRRVFWKKSHMWFFLALLGISLTRRVPPAAMLVIPYAKQARHRARKRGASNSDAAFLLIHDSLEIFATIRGAVRYRTVVL